MADQTTQDPQAQIAQMYQQYLGRAPDAGGLAFWENSVASGQNSLSDVAQGIANSQEAQAYATNKPSTPQTTSPLDTLNTFTVNPTTPPAPGSQGILDTPQGNAINQYYNQYLGRNAEDSGMQFWLNQMQNGASLSDVQQGIANSQEAQTRNVNQPNDFQTLYDQLRQQNQNQPGLLYAVQPMISNTDTAIDPVTDFVKNISQQPQYLQTAYQQQLARFNDPIQAARVVLGSLK